MALIRTRKSLASATLSGGARLVASGGGFPARITTAADIVLAGATELRGGVVFDPDGLHVWCNRRASGSFVKLRISDGTTIATLAATSPENLSRGLGSTKAYSCNTTTIYEIDLNTATLATYTSPVGSSYHCVQGSAGKAWVRTGNAAAGVYNEVTLATGIATGRTIAASWDLAYDSTNGKLFALKSNGSVERITESTLAVELTWTAPATVGHALPGYGNAFRALGLDSSRRPIVFDTDTSSAYRYQAAANALDARVFVGMNEAGHPPGATIGAARFQRRALAFSDDDSQVAWLQLNSAGASVTDALDVRIVKAGTQRARWAVANAGDAVTVKEITAGGAMGNNWWNVDAPPAGMATSQDMRRTRWFWSTNGGAARTEFAPGDDLSIALAGGGTLTVDADMQNWDRMLLAPPFVGGTSGEGIGVIWDDGLGGGPVVSAPFVPTIVGAGVGGLGLGLD